MSSWTSRASRRTRLGRPTSMARACPLRIAVPESTAHDLRQRIDPALVVRRRAERRAVVEVGAPVPGAVPPSSIDAAAQPRAPRAGSVARDRVSPRAVARSARTCAGRRQEPSEPHALAVALVRRPGSCRHSSRRNPSAAGRARRREAVLDGADAVVVERRRSAADARAGRSIVARAAERRPLDERHARPAARVAGHARGSGRPRTAARAIVGKLCPNARDRRRMPPVLHVAFAELPRRGPQELIAG